MERLQSETRVRDRSKSPRSGKHAAARRNARSPRGRCSKARARRGAACVEFAVVAPCFVVLMLGVSEASRLFDLQNQLALAAREGARFAAMDRTGMLQEGQSTNQKVEQDIKNFLDSNGLPSEYVDVHIVDPVDHVTTFDLDDPNNDLQLFEVRVEMPYSAVGGVGGSMNQDLVLTANVVFRNARAPALVQ